MESKNLEIKTNGQYKNIDLKEKLKVEVGGKTIIAQDDFVLDDGYIVVEKSFVEGMEVLSKTLKKKDGSPLKSYSCRVKYNGEDVSFWLDDTQHEAYKVLGGIGDRVKIIGEKTPNTNPKAKNKYFLNLKFELVQ